jgi:putative redox protein
VQVHLTHGKVHATDCETCETQDGKVDRIYRDIHLKGNLDAKQRARLLEIANRCPVHRSLHSEFEVITRELTPAEETENGAAS